MKRIVTILAILAIVGVGIFFEVRRQNPGHVAQNPTPQNNDGNNHNLPEGDQTGLGLAVPKGFGIQIVAKDLTNARAVVMDPSNNLWVSQTSEGKISKVSYVNGLYSAPEVFLQKLKKPHGLAFDPQNANILYFAEEDKVSKVDVTQNPPKATVIKSGLPTGGRHFSRTIKFGPDGRLYLSIGSSCDICVEPDPLRARIFSMNKDGSDFQEFARGIKNAVFFDWSLVDGRMWATDNGSDHLGNNLPPDEIDIVEKGKNYGWPNCYGKNIHDNVFDKNTYIRNPCMEPFETPSYIDLPAHSAPLGVAFVPEEGWPQDYWYNLVVAYHGSTYSDPKTGYKLVRIRLDAKGNYLGTEDFITGWLQDKKVLGRPVDVVTMPGGSMLVTDDKAGVIYRIYRTNPN
jgi:glucose/arabinose dehydrogenase